VTAVAARAPTGRASSVTAAAAGAVLHQRRAQDPHSWMETERSSPIAVLDGFHCGPGHVGAQARGNELGQLQVSSKIENSVITTSSNIHGASLRGKTSSLS